MPVRLTDTALLPVADHELVRIGRLTQLKFKRNYAARQDALASIRRLPDGQWSVRVGGAVRGKTTTVASIKAAQDAVLEHYNNALWASLGLEKK